MCQYSVLQKTATDRNVSKWDILFPLMAPSNQRVQTQKGQQAELSAHKGDGVVQSYSPFAILESSLAFSFHDISILVQRACWVCVCMYVCVSALQRL